MVVSSPTAQYMSSLGFPEENETLLELLCAILRITAIVFNLINSWPRSAWFKVIYCGFVFFGVLRLITGSFLPHEHLC